MHTLDTTNNLVTLDEARQYCGVGVAKAAIAQVTCVADTAASLSGKYWIISTPLVNYYVWYDVDGVSVDPEVASRTGIEVDIAEDDTALTVATATETALDALEVFGVEVGGPVLTVENSTAGACTSVGAGTSGFTVTEVVAGAATDPTYDDVLRMLINSASSEFIKETGRKVKQQSITEYYDGHGDYILWLNSPPVTGLTLSQDSLYEFDTDSVISSDDYQIDTDTGRIELTGDRFFSGPRVIKAVYTGGYTSIPYMVRAGALAWIAKAYQDWAHQSQSVTSRSGEESSTYDKDDVGAWVKAVRAYRKPV